jgi:ribosomal protein S21
VSVLRQPLSRRSQVVKVVVRENESPEQTLNRFNRLVSKAYARPWHKRRYGYHEKPSTLKRKQNRTRRHNRRSYARGGTGVRLRINLEAQFKREGNSNAMGS